MTSTDKTQKYKVIAIVVLIALLGAAIYLYWTQHKRLLSISEKHAQAQINLSNEQLEKEGLLSLTEDQDEQLKLLAGELERITGVVNIIEKIQNTDEELLQKYSKVYFLNEHYVPSSLRSIPETFVDSKDEEEKIHTKVSPKLRDMIEDAEDDEVYLRVVSAYRSFNEQTELKASYTVLYGSGANTFSADQGFSEHQLGTAVDFSIEGAGRQLDGFETTAAYRWLQDNAYRYGFVLSYPENNSYYIFEPWHWRFVGTDLARDLHSDQASFYDWDQRKIDEYLVKIFD